MPSHSDVKSLQQGAAHDDVQIVPTAHCLESKKGEEMDNYSVTKEIDTVLRGERRSMFQNNSCFAGNQPLKTPCYPDSLAPSNLLVAAESPMCLSADSLSPMLLSPLRKSSGVDLSIYLPDNFTPAATTEALESSLDGRMFQFPAVGSGHSPAFRMDVDTRESDGHSLAKHDVEKSAHIEVALRYSCETASTSEMDFDDSLHGEFSRLYSDCSSRWTSTVSDDVNRMGCETDSDAEDRVDNVMTQSFCSKTDENQRTLSAFLGKVEITERTEAIKAVDKDKEMSVSVRNKLERERRKNMNSKLEKLRQIVPEISQNKRVSKVTILKKAADYARELSVEESSLFARKAAEKAINKKLIRQLIQLTSNM